jgi:predicted nuclease with TOPRIM domain
MIRDLMLLPGVPRRLLDDIREMRELMRELVGTNDDLARTSRSMDAKMDKLDVANERLERALGELQGFNEKLDRLDTRVARVEREMAVIRGGMEEVAQIVPEMGKGPLEKAKEAFTGQ